MEKYSINDTENFNKLSNLESITINDINNGSKEDRDVIQYLRSILIPSSKELQILHQFDRVRVYKSELIICRKIHHDFDESNYNGNTPDIKHKTLISINSNNQLIYKNIKKQLNNDNNSDREDQDIIIDTIGDIKDDKDNKYLIGANAIWAMNHKGKMCIYAFNASQLADRQLQVHHTFLFKRGGLANAVICAGQLIVRKGKIIYLTNDSGRYQPLDIQLIQATFKLYQMGVLDNDATIFCAQCDKTLTLNQVLVIFNNISINK